MGPNETYKLLHSKGNYKQDKKKDHFKPDFEEQVGIFLGVGLAYGPSV